MAGTQAEKVARQYLDGLNALDVDAVIAVFSSDAVIRYPGLGVTDREGFRAYLGQATSVLSAFRIDDHELFSTDQGAAAHWSFDAKLNNGRSARCEGIDSWVVSPDGRIQVMDVYYDPSPLQAALQG